MTYLHKQNTTNKRQRRRRRIETSLGLLRSVAQRVGHSSALVLLLLLLLSIGAHDLGDDHSGTSFRTGCNFGYGSKSAHNIETRTGGEMKYTD